MNYDTLIYDAATSKSRSERLQRLEALLHAILRRHHPNGCELSRIDLEALERVSGLTFRWSENPQRGTVIVSSPNKKEQEQ